MRPVVCRTVRVLSEKELALPEMIQWKAEMLQNAYRKFGECLPIPPDPNKNLQGRYLELYKEALAADSKDLAEESVSTEPPIPADCRNNFLEDNAVESPVDMLINAEVMLPSVKNDGTNVLFCVKNRSRNEKGECVGEYHESAPEHSVI